MKLIQDNLKKIIKKINNIAILNNRDPKTIRLIAVSKNQSIDNISKVASLGQISFGENYVQESIKKIQLTRSTYPNLKWHFIGLLQSNKTRLVAENFSWCHTINRICIARRLNDQRPNSLPPLNVLIQVNISNEIKKSGTSSNEIFNIANQILSLPNLRLRGLMAIPKIEKHYHKQLDEYKNFTKLFKNLKNNFRDIDTISLGMSNDIEAAIVAGSTMLRIGTAIFGTRDNCNNSNRN
ncbi:YggS family pyridoxal phosphate-dependent enzyme [Candidatus Pantoea edessiphila]|uniref:Pyridoxal phosphate homeostasis protein n=1 Tax=Candidatus Pantoea edessiphila TaxID=2044610 RepID=A0A2P5SVX0_9GAMM|nr:YggS family pyridoxal phosphate-dependent enzyme [Candidatus Pantoea edessiphila]PPI86462.1 YggS family pyridoxal phosphate-dependent enzyme [Candidatus Pantoea edessiphila]